MNHQTDCGPHPHARIKHVNGSRVFRVESVQSGSCSHTWHSLLSHEHVEGLTWTSSCCRVMTVNSCAVVASPPAISRSAIASACTVKACGGRLESASHRWG